MNDLYQELLNEVHKDYKTLGISRVELERIVDSEFYAIRESMIKREPKVIQLIHLGKFRPTKYYKDTYDVKTTRDI